MPESEVLQRLDTGVYINNVWYLNYSDRTACRITGMTRFVTFWVENGVIQAPLNVMRFDETLYRMLGEKLLALTTERELILDPSTYGERSTASSRMPGAIVDDFTFTRAAHRRRNRSAVAQARIPIEPGLRAPRGRGDGPSSRGAVSAEAQRWNNRRRRSIVAASTASSHERRLVLVGLIAGAVGLQSRPPLSCFSRHHTRRGHHVSTSRRAGKAVHRRVDERRRRALRLRQRRPARSLLRRLAHR